MVALTPEVPEIARQTATEQNLGFRLLCDRNNQVAHKFGIVFTLPPDLRDFYQSLGIDLPVSNGEPSYELPLPATYAIDPSGTIRAAHLDPDYVKRMEPGDILAALRSISR